MKSGSENGDFPLHRQHIFIYLTHQANLSPRLGIVWNGEDLTLHVASMEGKRHGSRRPLRTGNEEAIIIVPRKLRN